MKFLRFEDSGRRGVAVALAGTDFVGFMEGDAGYPGDLTAHLLETLSLDKLATRLSAGRWVDYAKVKHLPPLAAVKKIICVGLNYAEHAAEANREVPVAPTIFTRYETSYVGDGQPLVRPPCSEQFDYEGELVAVIGRGGRRIPKAQALDHVVAWSLFNDGSIRDWQRRTPQWTMGKNFDASGSFGPYLVSADELPRGAVGLRLQTRLNGQVVQNASTDDMVFDVATLISHLSEAITLETGDLIVTGTPSGVGMARKPPLWMKAGDVVEVEVEKLGVLRNTVEDERA